MESGSDSDEAGAPTAAQRAKKKKLSEQRYKREERYKSLATFWHEATGHTNLTYLRSICTTVDGMEELQRLPKGFKLPPCSICMLAKSRALPTPKKAERSKLVHHLVHSDTTGKMRVRSMRGNYYHTVFVDDASDFKIVKCHPLKSDYPEIYAARNVLAGRAPAVLHTDNAGEMTSTAFEATLAAEGTFHQKSVPYSQYQNGRAEAAIRTVSTRARTLLMHSGLPAAYWDYSVEYAAFLENVARPFMRGSLFTPYEKFYGKPPATGLIKPFGCYCVTHLGKERVKDGKWSARGEPGVFIGMGFDEGYKAYRVLNPSTKRITYAAPSRIAFECSYFPFRGIGSGQPRFPLVSIPIEEEMVDEPTEDDHPSVNEPYVLRGVAASPYAAFETPPHVQASPGNQAFSRAPSLNNAPSRSASPGIIARDPAGSVAARSQASRSSHAPHMYPVRGVPDPVNESDPTAWARGLDNISVASYCDVHFEAHACDAEVPILDNTPVTLADAKASPYWDKWEEALKAERRSLEVRGVFKSCTKIPPGVKLMKAKIVYKQKKDQKGNVTRFKCRCVAKGYSQVEFVNYYDTFAAVASGSYVRTCLSIGLASGMKIRHLDVVTAFLYPLLKEKLFMEMPEDLALYPGEVVELVRSIYGTRQAAHNWSKELITVL